jgi:hypothetical protein
MLLKTLAVAPLLFLSAAALAKNAAVEYKRVAVIGMPPQAITCGFDDH